MRFCRKGASNMGNWQNSIMKPEAQRAQEKLMPGETIMKRKLAALIEAAEAARHMLEHIREGHCVAYRAMLEALDGDWSIEKNLKAALDAAKID